MADLKKIPMCKPVEGLPATLTHSSGPVEESQIFTAQ